jgi:hypothetical protein
VTSRIAGFRPRFAGLPFRCQLALELLAGNLAADQTGEGADGGIGARGIVPGRFRPGRGRYYLDTDPVPLKRHCLRKSLARKGLEVSKTEIRYKE